MKRRKLKTAFIATSLGLCTVLILAGILVLAPQTDALSRSTQKYNLLVDAQNIQNNQLKFLHTAWFNSTYQYGTVTVPGKPSEDTKDPTEKPADVTLEVLIPPGGFTDENPIRKQASALYATGLALGNGTYSGTRTGITDAEATRRAVAWTNALALSYQTDGWAHGWQSALWTYYMGMGAKQIWTSIPPATQDLVTKDVASEADHLLTVPPPFYKDAQGRVLTPGDSKSEENAWNAQLLFLAAWMFPENPNAAAWENQAKFYHLTAYATPNQVGHDPRITGSNLNANGTVTNHHHDANPDYMASDAEMLAKTIIMGTQSSHPVPSESKNNLILVWRGFTRLKFSAKKYGNPGGTIFRTDWRHRPTGNIYFPKPLDWSKDRRITYAETSVVVFNFNMDAGAYGWAHAQLHAVLKQQARHQDGHIYNPGETKYPVDEQFGAASAAEITEILKH